MAAEAKGPGATIQMETGFVRLANRLLEAILMAPFSGPQLRIVLALFRLTYGWRRISVKLTVSELATFAGMPPGPDAERAGGAFRKDLRDLVRSGVVLAPDARSGAKVITWAVQKDYAKWGRFSVAEGKLKATWDVAHRHDDSLIRDAKSDLPNENDADGKAEESDGNEGDSDGNDPARTQASSDEDEKARLQASAVEDPAPHQASTRPDTGPAPGPISGQMNPATAIESNDLEARKDSKDSKDITTTTTTVDDDSENGGSKAPSPESVYTLGITVAANRAIEAKWGEQIHPLYYGASSQLAADLMTDGVPLDVAQSSILAQVKASKNPEPPSSINYFRRGILQAAKSDEQRALDRSDIPVAEGVSARGGMPTSIAYVVSQQSDRADYDMDRHYEAERDRAAKAWSDEPANAARFNAIVAKAQADNAIIAGTKMGDRAIARDVMMACGIAAGFPAREVWKAARNVPRGAVENTVDSVDN